MNVYKARIFMGDVGAFFLGGLLSSIFILEKCEILLIFSGIVLVINTLMIILQYISFRIYKKRLFSFTPYHHALEKKGWSENQICILYSFISLIGSLLSLFFRKNYY
jgi:phospho-N-acetylmuramoyl-pentapeptide-transferase